MPFQTMQHAERTLELTYDDLRLALEAYMRAPSDRDVFETLKQQLHKSAMVYREARECAEAFRESMPCFAELDPHALASAIIDVRGCELGLAESRAELEIARTNRQNFKPPAPPAKTITEAEVRKKLEGSTITNDQKAELIDRLWKEEFEALRADSEAKCEALKLRTEELWGIVHVAANEARLAEAEKLKRKALDDLDSVRLIVQRRKNSVNTNRTHPRPAVGT